jgi:hypothetical protein
MSENKMRSLLFSILALLGMTSCKDYSNRVYHYGEEIPAKPYVMKVAKAEYQFDGKECLIKVSLQILHKGLEKHTLTKDQFSLRVDGQEFAHDSNFREKIGLNAIEFSPGEEAIITIPFVIPGNVAQQRFDLIVDRADKKGTTLLTLVYLKKESAVKETAEWREENSANWN